MITILIALVIGIAIGAIATVLVARNNRNKIENVLAAADKVEDKYKNYMTKPKQ